MQEETAMADTELFANCVSRSHGLGLSTVSCTRGLFVCIFIALGVSGGDHVCTHFSTLTCKILWVRICLYVYDYTCFTYVCICVYFWVCISLQAQLCEFMHLEYADVCICCAHSHQSEPLDICAHAYWSFLITSVLSTDSCFNNIYSWASTLTAVAPSCYQDCFSPFRITSAQCSLNISLLLIPKQRCNDFY